MAASSSSHSASENAAILGSVLETAATTSAASVAVDLNQLLARQKAITVERRALAKDIAKEKRKRKRVLQATRTLSEDDLAQEILARRLRSAREGS